MIKNLSGQEFADFDAWKEWAIAKTNIHPLVTEFIDFYPWIITEEQGAQATEEFSNKLKEQEMLWSLDYEMLESFGYKWLNDFYNFDKMDLRPNGDGTYTLVNVESSATDVLRIPECVSRIEYNALKEATFNVISFPDSFESTSPFYVSFKYYPYVYTKHPLNIESDKWSLDNLSNGYYEIPYTAFRRLCSVWPSAFVGDTPLIEDCGCLCKGGELRRISNDSVYAAYSASNVLLSNEILHTISRDSDMVPLDQCKVVAMEISQAQGRVEADIVTVPESVEVLIVRRELKELIILGNPKHVYLDVVPGKVKVNAKINEVRSQALKDLYKDYRYGYERVVFNLPDLCDEKSVNAGYIRVTAAAVGRCDGFDRVVEINADHVVLMGPETIVFRDKPVTGTLIHLAWNGNEQSFLTVLAYEPMDMIAEKINKAKA